MTTNEHPTRPGHIIATVSDTDDRVTCTHVSHTHRADAFLCGFDAVWHGATTKTEEVPTVEHKIMVRKHTMSSERLVATCSCGDLFEEPEYAAVMTPFGEEYGVPLSVLMDIAEKHQHDADAERGI